jgi:Ser/Thr protein kinase RdoA (MazF antagonist)
VGTAPDEVPDPEPELLEITPAAVAACNADDSKPKSAASREPASGELPTAAEVAEATAAGRALGRLKRARRDAAYVWAFCCCC